MRDAGVHLAFVTNNASRTPEKVAANLISSGSTATAADVVTSAQAAARVMRGTVRGGARVLLLGGAGLEAALAAEELVVTTEPGRGGAVVSGYGPDVLWKDIMRAATLVRDGLPYVASNTDLTIPTDYGLAPGHGVLVRTISDFAGVEPIVAGKPARPLMDETIRRVGGDRPLMVGDRLDTDIEGAHAVGGRLAAGDDRRDAPRRAGGGRPPSCARATSRPISRGSSSRTRRPELDGRQRRLGGWPAPGRRRACSQVDGDGRDADWWRVVAVAGWAAPGRDREPRSTSTALRSPVTSSGEPR